MPSFCLNHSSVSADFVEGEVIAIHLGTGVYYSLRGPAAEIWRGLEQPADPASLARRLVAGFVVTADVAERDAAAFVERLRAEELVIASEPAPSATGNPPAPGAARLPYAPPVLERFADLQDLLLLDPIHDVSAQGWPNRPPQAGSAGA